MTICPCGSSIPYDDCCRPVIHGAKNAATAEELMRARYAAYVNAEMDFIFTSTHPGHREGYDHEGTKSWAEQSEWLGLEILATGRGGAEDRDGTVEFIARFRENGVPRSHHESAQFIREAGQWYFTEGTMAKQQPLSVSKTGRNEPCPCGSGKKFKKCCGA